jgi:hypothetical protein
MRCAFAADHCHMAKSDKQNSDEERELRPEMRDLILRFDAKDRREADGKASSETRKERRRRGDDSARAA